MAFEDEFKHWPPLEPGERRFVRPETLRSSKPLFYRCLPGRPPIYWHNTAMEWKVSMQAVGPDSVLGLATGTYEINCIPLALRVSEGL